MKEENINMTENPDQALIELKGITKVYGKGQAALQALRGIDLCIYEGDFVAVMGPSGCGKSTCMNVLGCLDTPTSGHYLFKGIDIADLSRDQLALLRRHYLGFVFQGFNLLSRTSALENVELPLLYRGIHHSQRAGIARDALDAVGLTGWEHHTPAELSGGQQQRVAIARALVNNAPLLLADEPTGNLDTKTSIEIMELFVRLNEEKHITIVLVTHEPDISVFSKRIIRFLDGKIVSDKENKP